MKNSQGSKYRKKKIIHIASQQSNVCYHTGSHYICVITRLGTKISLISSLCAGIITQESTVFYPLVYEKAGLEEGNVWRKCLSLFMRHVGEPWSEKDVPEDFAQSLGKVSHR